MGKIKKILFVDCSEDNLSSAELFFRRTGVETLIFCKSLEEARKNIQNASVIITEKRIPFSVEKMFNVDFVKSTYEDAYTVAGKLHEEAELSEANGYLLLYEAQLMNKPAFMMTDNRGVLEISKVKEFDAKSFNIAAGLAKNTNGSFEELLQRLKEIPQPLDYYTLWLYANYGGLDKDIYKGHQIFKTNSMAWAIVWEKIKNLS
jgi:hypothetical protein